MVFANAQLWSWLAIAFAAIVLLHLLSPILAPFLLAAILAYMLDPLVEKLGRRLLPRAAAAMLVLLLVLALLVALALVVLPLFARELRELAARLPAALAWAQRELAPWLRSNFGVVLQLDLDTLRQSAGDLLSGNQNLLERLLGSLKIGGLALFGFLANLLLVPVVAFYLLRDWNLLVERVDRLIPRRMHAKAREMVREIDAVLAEFLRGEMLVILVMSVYYVVALWLARLEFALPVGILTGLLVFVPYVGALTGILLGTAAALLQFANPADVLWVWLAFGVGYTLDGTFVTPMIVGRRIGLHPVAVIFALLAFGQVFGFFGVLLALPASAALLVGLRHLRRAYLASSLYGGAR